MYDTQTISLCLITYGFGVIASILLQLVVPSLSYWWIWFICLSFGCLVAVSFNYSNVNSHRDNMRDSDMFVEETRIKNGYASLSDSYQSPYYGLSSHYT
jgi:hypothetical protein